MEHSFLIRGSPILVSFFVVLLLASCRKQLENPELSDPIYIDLGYDINATRNFLQTEEKTVAELRDKFKSLPIRDIGRNQILREIAAREKNIIQFRQTKLYLEVRQALRKEQDLKSYAEAFAAERPWPDPKEVAEYKKIKELKAAPRSWETRVPKTTRYTKKNQPVEEKGKADEPAPKAAQ